MLIRVSTYLLFALLCQTISAQQTTTIDWLTFEQLEDSLKVKPKKVLINFYADWCVYCKKMEKVGFRDLKVISKLNTSYYAVKMNAESTDTISFGGGIFVNKQLGTKRNPTHEIPLLLASRKNRPFTLPALIVLNEKFEITARYFEYLSPKKLLKVLDE
ncbi:thioredoxin fold domain-containing protein [Spongiivirga sp. MCCC 1A20706]|uniref:thioredoxin family protein n=1 Tax=Spongiivirga sp. MCCC 1A20706 TaxID=3160963 RepID=UPI00397771B2